MEWKEFEINDFEGIATASRKPKKTEAMALENFDLREITGDLVLRQGYKKKYDCPSGTHRLTNNENLAYENLYISEVGTPTDISILIQKAKLTGLVNSLSVPADIDFLAVWASHTWNGSDWVLGWDLLNETYLTKIKAVDTNKYIVTLDLYDDAGIISGDTFAGWYILQRTTGQVHRIIKTQDAGESIIQIKITCNNHSWVADDEVLIMRQYLPESALTQAADIISTDVVTHKVNSDLRIGFGATIGRMGLCLGYRKRYLAVDEIVYLARQGNPLTKIIDTDLSSPPLKVRSFDGLCLDVFNPAIFGSAYDFVTEQMQVSSARKLESGNYDFLFSIVLDNYLEYTVKTKRHESLGDGYGIYYTPRAIFGVLSPRTTHFYFYASGNSSPYYNIGNRQVGSSLEESGMFIDDSGYLVWDRFVANANVNIFTDFVNTEIKCAIDTSYDYNNVAHFSAVAGGDTTFTSAATMYDNDSTKPSVNMFALSPWLGVAAHIVAFKWDFESFSPNIFEDGKTYEIQFYCKKFNAASKTLNPFVFIRTDEPAYNTAVSFAEPSNDYWKKYSVKIRANVGTLVNVDVCQFGFGYTAPQELVGENICSLFIDAVMIKEVDDALTKDNFATGESARTQIGYTPTSGQFLNSWDRAINAIGKVFYVNGLFNGADPVRNKVFLSVISGAGAFMRDVVVPSNYVDSEKFDGNDILGIAFLKNYDFIILQKLSIQRVNPDTQASQVIDNYGMIGKNAYSNGGATIIFCSNEDIYITDGLNVKNISEGKIRDQYRALTNKGGIIAIHEARDNSPRIFSGNTSTKTEFILTGKGWITAAREHIPFNYSKNADNVITFLNESTIYEDDKTASEDAGTPFTAKWLSAPIDIGLLGEGIKTNHRFVLGKIWLRYSSTVPVNFSVYLDGELFQTIVIPKTHDGTTEVDGYFSQRLRLHPQSRIVQFGLYATTQGEGFTDTCRIKSLGALYKILSTGAYG